MLIHPFQGNCKKIKPRSSSQEKGLSLLGAPSLYHPTPISSLPGRQCPTRNDVSPPHLLRRPWAAHLPPQREGVSCMAPALTAPSWGGDASSARLYCWFWPYYFHVGKARIWDYHTAPPCSLISMFSTGISSDLYSVSSRPDP